MTGKRVQFIWSTAAGSHRVAFSFRPALSRILGATLKPYRPWWRCTGSATTYRCWGQTEWKWAKSLYGPISCFSWKAAVAHWTRCAWETCTWKFMYVHIYLIVVWFACQQLQNWETSIRSVQQTCVIFKLTRGEARAYFPPVTKCHFLRASKKEKRKCIEFWGIFKKLL